MNDEKRRTGARESLSRFLAQNGKRNTPERIAILECMLEMRTPFTVESLFDRLSEGGLRVSRATAYNSVNLFACAGLVRRLHTGEDAELWEMTDDRTCHIRLVCLSCGKVKEVRDNELSRTLSLKRYQSFVTSGFELYITGTCSRCRSRSRRSD